MNNITNDLNTINKEIEKLENERQLKVLKSTSEKLDIYKNDLTYQVDKFNRITKEIKNTTSRIEFLLSSLNNFLFFSDMEISRHMIEHKMDDSHENIKDVRSMLNEYMTSVSKYDQKRLVGITNGLG